MKRVVAAVAFLFRLALAPQRARMASMIEYDRQRIEAEMQAPASGCRTGKMVSRTDG